MTFRLWQCFLKRSHQKRKHISYIPKSKGQNVSPGQYVFRTKYDQGWYVSGVCEDKIWPNLVVLVQLDKKKPHTLMHLSCHVLPLEICALMLWDCWTKMETRGPPTPKATPVPSRHGEGAQVNFFRGTKWKGGKLTYAGPHSTLLPKQVWADDFLGREIISFSEDKFCNGIQPIYETYQNSYDV